MPALFGEIAQRLVNDRCALSFIRIYHILFVMPGFRDRQLTFCIGMADIWSGHLAIHEVGGSGCLCQFSANKGVNRIQRRRGGLVISLDSTGG